MSCGGAGAAHDIPECRHQAGQRLLCWEYFVGRGQDTGDRESHQGTKGKQGNTQETRMEETTAHHDINHAIPNSHLLHPLSTSSWG